MSINLENLNKVVPQPAKTECTTQKEEKKIVYFRVNFRICF